MDLKKIKTDKPKGARHPINLTNQTKNKPMKTKHTKGEWHVTPNGEYVGTLGQGKTGVCMILMKGREEGQANAKLIASAPELLEALLAVQKDLEQFSLLPSTENLVNNAILKAIK
jgi:hypothetical protein